MDIHSFVVYLGVIRKSRLFYAPAVPLFIWCVICFALVAFFGAAWLLLVPFGWYVLFIVTKNDDNAFRIIYLWLITKFFNVNKGFWNASTYAPVCHAKRVKKLRNHSK